MNREGKALVCELQSRAHVQRVLDPLMNVAMLVVVTSAVVTSILTAMAD